MCRVHRANTPLSCIMFDRFIVKGRIKPFNPSDRDRFTQVTITEKSLAKTKPTTTFVKTPLTGAQMELSSEVEMDALGTPWLVVQSEVFAAASLAGQNFIHGDLDGVGDEVTGAGKLVRLALLERGFSPAEIDFYMKYSSIEELELTWHRATRSRNAAKALLKRAIRHFQALESISGRHDSAVESVKLNTEYAITGVLVTFKNGCQLRLYIKAEAVEAGQKRKQMAGFVSKAMREHVAEFKRAVTAHVRIEPILGSAHLAEHGMTHPNDVSAERLDAALNSFMRMARLDVPFAMEPGEIDTSSLGPEITDSLMRHFDGIDVLAELPPHSATRHRQALLPRVELAVRRTRNPALAATLCKQLAYEARWRPDEGLLRHAFTSDRAASTLEDLAALVAAQEAAFVYPDEEDAE